MENYTHDTVNCVNGITSPAAAFTCTYNAGVGGFTAFSSLVKEIALPYGAAITNAFDTNGRMTVTALSNNGGTNLDSSAYTYDLGSERPVLIRTGVIKGS
jgi:hypothetical protein